MKSSKRIAVIMLFVVLFATTMAYAVVFDDWYANYTADDIYNVGYWEQNMPYCVNSLASNATFTSNFLSAVNNAVGQWDSALPISISGTSANYALTRIYGGTFTELENVFPELIGNEAGKTVPYRTYVDEIVAGGATRYVSSMDGAKMCIVNRGYEYSYILNATLHELGHTLGWLGHNTSPSNVMYYRNSNTPTTLTAADKNHIKQIYDVFG